MDIAERVLEGSRRPLTARQILTIAYQQGVVPAHLYGATQHKTLQARLSEDILAKKDHSTFFRPKPGHFFLRRFLTDTSIPAEHRQPIVARRRTRDLLRGPALAVQRQVLEAPVCDITNHVLSRSAEVGKLKFVDPKRLASDWLLVWSIAVVIRNGRVLTYRPGRYRDDRDSFAMKRTIAFSSLVPERSPSLFDQEDHFGIKETALESVIIDLDVPSIAHGSSMEGTEASFFGFVREDNEAFADCLLALVVVRCPSWFEPTARRLSLNDVRWVDLRPIPNNFEDLDPWSQSIWNRLAE